MGRCWIQPACSPLNWVFMGHLPTHSCRHPHKHTQHRNADMGGWHTHKHTPVSYPETHKGTHSLQTFWHNTNAQTGTPWALTGHPRPHVPCRPAAHGHNHTSPPANKDQGPQCQTHWWPGPAASCQGCLGCATSLSSAPCHCPAWHSVCVTRSPLQTRNSGPRVCSSVQLMC